MFIFLWICFNILITGRESFFDKNKADVNKAVNSISRYLDCLLNIDNSFEQEVHQV